MTEEKDKQKRKLNLIIHNLPESASDDSQQRKHDDEHGVADIFKNVLQVTPNISNVVRLGKRGNKKGENGEDKVRLLKVTVETEKEKGNILRNAVKLRNDRLPDYQRKIFITPDLTLKEREENKALRAKLSELNKSENIYKIKNGRIVRRSQ